MPRGRPPGCKAKTFAKVPRNTRSSAAEAKRNAPKTVEAKSATRSTARKGPSRETKTAGKVTASVTSLGIVMGLRGTGRPASSAGLAGALKLRRKRARSADGAQSDRCKEASVADTAGYNAIRKAGGAKKPKLDKNLLAVQSVVSSKEKGVTGSARKGGLKGSRNKKKSNEKAVKPTVVVVGKTLRGFGRRVLPVNTAEEGKARGPQTRSTAKTTIPSSDLKPGKASLKALKTMVNPKLPKKKLTGGFVTSTKISTGKTTMTSGEQTAKKLVAGKESSKRSPPQGKVNPVAKASISSKSKGLVSVESKKDKSLGISQTRRPRRKLVSKKEVQKKRTHEMGYEDDALAEDFSFGSGLLDEDICFECGASTLKANWTDLIICDSCEGEYHWQCVGLELLPRRKFWYCPSCLKDSEVFGDLALQANSNHKVCYHF